MLPPLLRAASDGNLTEVQRLIDEAGIDPKTEDDGMQAIHWAARDGHLNVVRFLHEEHKVSIDVEARKKYTPLHYACGRRGNLATVEYLLRNGAQLDAQTSFGGTPLSMAASFGNTVVAKHLVRVGSCINKITDDGVAPILSAIRGGNKDIVILFLKHGADATVFDSKGCGAFSIIHDKLELAQRMDTDQNVYAEISEIISAHLRNPDVIPQKKSTRTSSPAHLLAAHRTWVGSDAEDVNTSPTIEPTDNGCGQVNP